MKGIDYLTEINQHLPCIVTFRHPHPKKLVFALSGTRDLGIPHAAKSPR